jgi:ATP-binding protein involved in chromosome partitioning
MKDTSEMNRKDSCAGEERSKAEKVAEEMGIPFLGRLPVDPDLAALCDRGEIEKFDKDYVDNCIEMLENRKP